MPLIDWSYGQENDQAYIHLSIYVNNQSTRNFQIENVHSWLADTTNTSEPRKDFRLAKSINGTSEPELQPMFWRRREKLPMRAKTTQNFKFTSSDFEKSTLADGSEIEKYFDSEATFTRYDYSAVEDFPAKNHTYKAMFIKGVITSDLVQPGPKFPDRSIGFSFSTESNIFPDVYTFEDCTLEGCFGSLV